MVSSLSRRTFLKAATAATAVATFGGRGFAANERIGVGIIGCRNRGPQVAESMLRTRQFAIVALCDCDDAMLAEGVKALEGKAAPAPKGEKDFRRLLEDPAIDAVVVATPDHWHAMMTVMALDAGKHVYIEKPASHTIADGKAMVAAAAKHPDRVVQVGTQQRSGRHFAAAKEFIASGGLGKVAFARGSFITERHEARIIPDDEPPAGLDYDMWIGPGPMRPYNRELHHYNWHFLYDFGTGDMGNWGAHWLDVIRWLLDLDLPTSAAGYGGQYVVNDAKEWPDTQTVLYQFPDLTLLWELRHWSRFMPGGGKGNCCEISGDKGSMIIDRGGWSIYPREKDAEREDKLASELDVSHAFNFAKAIRGQEAVNAPLIEGHKSATLCHLGNIATRLNRSIRFDPGGETIVGDAEAIALMARAYRAPWRLEQYL